MLSVVKYFFPTFEFTWLGEEMEQKYVPRIGLDELIPARPPLPTQCTTIVLSLTD